MSKVQVYKARTVFDTPRYNPEGKYGPYYSMMIELPEGAPGTKYDEQYDRIYAYMSYDEDHDDAQELYDLGRGAEFTVVWTGNKYQPALDGNVNGAASTPAKATTTKQTRQQAIEPTPKHILDEAYRMLAWETCNRVLTVYEAVSEDERAGDMSPDEKLRVAITGTIQANREASRELSRVISLVEHETIHSVDRDELPNSLLEAIAHLLQDKYDSVAELSAKLKELGLSSADIDPDDESTWFELYEIAKSVPTDEVEEQDNTEPIDFDEDEDDELPPF